MRDLGKSQYLTGNRFVQDIFSIKEVKHTNSLLNITLLSFQKKFKILIKKIHTGIETKSNSKYKSSP